MEQAKPSVQPTKKERPKSPPWAQMTPGQKAVFVVKVAVCILTFGFVFPSISSD